MAQIFYAFVFIALVICLSIASLVYFAVSDSELEQEAIKVITECERDLPRNMRCKLTAMPEFKL